MSVRMIVLMFIGYTVLSFACIGMGALWLVKLQPALPLVPALCGALALLCAGMAGAYFTKLGE